jgi:uncharacterized protein (TIGR03435 family)
MPWMLAIAMLTAVISPALAQSASPRPQFEVASIKLDKSEEPGLVRVLHGGRFTLLNLRMQNIVTIAYHLKRDSLLAGAPAWFMSERYDVDARAEGSPSFDVMRTMLQALLEERLRLKFHQEIKEQPIYSLVVAKPGRLDPINGDCAPISEPPDPAKFPSGPCGFLFTVPGQIAGQKATISQLADALSLNTDRVVLDRTNLGGKYNIKLEYTPEGPIPPPLAEPGAPPLPPIDPNGPSLFSALQEQLGLKLESQKGPVEVMVIDQIERPSEN